MPLTFSRRAGVALCAIALMTWIHVRGVGPGRLISNVLAGLKVSALLIFIALGFSIGDRLGEQPRARLPVRSPAARGCSR